MRQFMSRDVMRQIVPFICSLVFCRKSRGKCVESTNREILAPVVPDNLLTIKIAFYIGLMKTGHIQCDIVTCRLASSTQVSLVLCLSIYILILRYDGQVYKFHTILNLYEHVNNHNLYK